MGTSGLAEKAAAGRASRNERARRPARQPRPRRCRTRARNIHFSPYRVFAREEWAKLRADTPMTLVPRDLEQLSGV